MPKALAQLKEFTGIGSVLAGKYEIERIVGTGGMGVVVAARHLHLGTQVAIKFLLPRVIDQEKLVVRFQREAQAASRIAGPHVVRVLDVDLRADGVPYIVMEFLEGETLQSLLRNSGPLALAESVDYVLEAGEALAEAHAAGIAHRDLKPANLFLARGSEHERTIKVLDFGIAKLFESEQAESLSGITATGAFIGSPPYMSPEQLARPASVDSRTDIWSLGIVLYECLTGVTPFAASGLGQTCASILQEAPLPVASLRPELPKAIDRILSRCLAKAREERFPTVHELARELSPFGTERAARSLRVLERTQGRTVPAPALDTGASAPPRVLPALSGSDTETALAETAIPPSKGAGGRQAWPLAVLLTVVAAAIFGNHLAQRRPVETGVSSSSALAAPDSGPPLVSASPPVTANSTQTPAAAAPAAAPAASSASPKQSPRRAGKVPKLALPATNEAEADSESVYMERK